MVQILDNGIEMTDINGEGSLIEYNELYFIDGFNDRCFKCCPFGIALYEKNKNNYIHSGIVGKHKEAIRWLKYKNVKNIISVYRSNGKMRSM